MFLFTNNLQNLGLAILYRPWQSNNLHSWLLI